MRASLSFTDYFNLILTNVDYGDALMFRIEEMEDRGRTLLAVSDVKKGTVLFREKSLMNGPLHDSPPICLNCHRKVDNEVCSICSLPLCQIPCKSYHAHEELECQIFTKVKLARSKLSFDDLETNNPLYQCITPLRLLLTRDNWMDKWNIIQNMSGSEDTEQTRECENNVVNYLIDYWKLDFSKEDVRHVVEVLKSNAFEINTSTKNKPGGLGRGVFPLLSLLNHSCAPNVTFRYVEDDSMECFAIKDIRADEELFSSYISLNDDTETRRDILRAGWNFECQCVRCVAGE